MLSQPIQNQILENERLFSYDILNEIRLSISNIAVAHIMTQFTKAYLQYADNVPCKMAPKYKLEIISQPHVRTAQQQDSVVTPESM